MQQSPSSEANRSSATQEIPRISCNPKVHYHTHKRRPHVRTQNQRISPSPRHCEIFRNISSFYGEELLAPRPTHKLRTTHCPMSATAHSIHQQLLCISGGRSSVRSLRMRQTAMTVTPLIFLHTVTQNYGRLVVSNKGKMSAGVHISCSSVEALESGFATCGTVDSAKTRP